MKPQLQPVVWTPPVDQPDLVYESDSEFSWQLWDEAERQLDALVGRLTLQDKVTA